MFSLLSATRRTAQQPAQGCMHAVRPLGGCAALLPELRGSALHSAPWAGCSGVQPKAARRWEVSSSGAEPCFWSAAVCVRGPNGCSRHK